jgi:hypothetical protein
MKSPPQGHRGREPGIGFADRLLAEAVRVFERDGARPIDDPRAEAKATGAGGDFEHRIAVRARSLDASRNVSQALGQTRQVIGVIMALGMLLAALAGAGAARASLAAPGDAPVNIYWALGGLLGIQTLLLAAWVVMMIKGPSALAGASLGGAVFALGRGLSGRWHKGHAHAAAIEATGVVMARGGVGRWMLSAISHGLWVVFNVMCLLLLVLMLSARHYRFVWETTILSADTYTRLTHGIAWAPGKLGFPTPTAQQIAAGCSSAASSPTPSGRGSFSWESACACCAGRVGGGASTPPDPATCGCSQGSCPRPSRWVSSIPMWKVSPRPPPRRHRRLKAAPRRDPRRSWGSRSSRPPRPGRRRSPG